MFGTFRMALALGVAWAHMGGHINGVNTGVTGVVCFFMVSGYAMSALIADSFPRLSDAPRFYVDRFLRLAPQYYFYLAICAFTVLVIGWRETPSQEGAPDAVNVMANVTIIPLTFWMFNKSIGSLILNIPSWSVGLEMCFYLVLPWLLRDRRDIRYAAALGAGVFALATHGAIPHPSPFWHGIIADCFSYRLLPGTLVFFLAGVALQRKDWLLFFSLAAFLEADALSLWLAGKISFAVNMHLLAGAAVGFVMVPLLALLPRNAIDEKIGAASYGAYLSHWIFTSALQHHRGEAWATAVVLLGAIASGWASYRWIEAPTVRLRKAMRARAGESSPAWGCPVTSFRRALGGIRCPASWRGHAFRWRASDRQGAL